MKKRGNNSDFVLKDKILKSKNLQEIKTILKRLDNEFDWKAKKEDILYLEKTLSISQTLKDLPCSNIEDKDVTYKIHGTVHDLPSHKVSKKVKEFIKTECEKYKNIYKEDYLCEEVIAEMLNLNNKIKEDFFLNAEASLSILFDSYVVFSEWLSNLIKKLSCRTNSKNRIEFEKEYILKIRNENILAALENPYYVLKLREIYSSLSRAPPLNEVQYRDKVVIKRSKYMSEYAKRYAKINSSKTLHLIVGLDHEYQIKTFLKYPDYSHNLLLANIYPCFSSDGIRR